MLGGSSSINYMLYVRGNKRDYDKWRDDGNVGWGYDDVLPYFMKSEDNRNPFLAGTKYHGKGGYLTVQEPAYNSPLAAAFIQGGVEMGYENRNCNGELQTGICNLLFLKICLLKLAISRFYDSSGNNPSG